MSGAEPTQPPVARREGVTPILRVRSLQASIDHYVRVLGFTLAWNEAGGHGVGLEGSRGYHAVRGRSG
jgi:catechol 2,3-dioxygenase-like lactoylglutathione lyase family enzyme